MKALITGATSGIGRELALLLAQDGVELILHGRNPQSLKELVATTVQMTKVDFVQADLASFEGAQVLLKVINDEVPDLVINSAGFGLYGDMLSQSEQELQAMIAANCAAVVAISHTAASLWKERKIAGTLLNIASALAFLPTPGAAVYGATKAFVTSFSQALDIELERYGIRVLTACPGRVATSFAERASHGFIGPQKPGGVVMGAQQVAKAILQQIKEKKPLVIIDWRYKLLLFLRALLPSRLAMKGLYKAMKSRVKGEA